MDIVFHVATRCIRYLLCLPANSCATVKLRGQLPGALIRDWLDLRYGVTVRTEIRAAGPHATARRVDHLLNDLTSTEGAPLEPGGPFDRVAHGCIRQPGRLIPMCDYRGRPFSAQAEYTSRGGSWKTAGRGRWISGGIGHGDGERTSELFDNLFRNPFLHVDLTIDIARARRSWRRGIWETCRNTESRCVEGCLRRKAT